MDSGVEGIVDGKFAGRLIFAKARVAQCKVRGARQSHGQTWEKQKGKDRVNHAGAGPERPPVTSQIAVHPNRHAAL